MSKKELSNDPGKQAAGGETRRSFLAKLGLAAAAIAAVSSVPFLRPGRDARGAESSEDFPNEDSIFHPAQDPRQDPRRN